MMMMTMMMIMMPLLYIYIGWKDLVGWGRRAHSSGVCVDIFLERGIFWLPETRLAGNVKKEDISTPLCCQPSGGREGVRN